MTNFAVSPTPQPTSMKLTAILLFAFATATASLARTWTNDQGRTIEAELVRMEAGEPIVKKGGQEIKLTLAKLSPADQAFVNQWQEQQASKPLMLDGKAIEKGGKINLVERPYSARMLKQLKEDKHEEETSIKIALAVPATFVSGVDIASARACVTFSKTADSWVAYPLTVSTRFGTRS